MSPQNSTVLELYKELHINLDGIATCATLQGHNKYLLERFLNGRAFIGPLSYCLNTFIFKMYFLVSDLHSERISCRERSETNFRV